MLWPTTPYLALLSMAITFVKSLPADPYEGTWSLQPYQGSSSGSYNDATASQADYHQGYHHTSEEPYHLTSGEQQGEYTSAEPLQQSDSLRQQQAFTTYKSTASRMGNQLGDATLRTRFGQYAKGDIFNDLLSNDATKQRLATASILMHRTAQSNKFNKQFKDLTFTTEPIYRDQTKEDILDRVFQVMGVAPAEDVRLWWYSRICSNKSPNTFSSLYSDNRRDQINAINNLSGLFYVDGFWVKTDPNSYYRG